VWRAGAGEPELVRGFVTWRVGDAAFQLPLAEMLRGV
jgi:hypothetical protein